MVKIKGLILLAIILAIGLAGCGDSSRGYAIFRSRALVTVFIPLPDTSEIAEVKFDNKALHVDIDTGEKIEKRVIQRTNPLMTRFSETVNTTIVCDNLPKFVNVSSRKRST